VLPHLTCPAHRLLSQGRGFLSLLRFGPYAFLEAMNEERWSIRVRWHPYDQGPARVEWLELPPEIARASISRRSEWISSYLREREGLPPDSHKPSERVLWIEFDSIRPTDQVPEDL
jgi:hypothetical protein